MRKAFDRDGITPITVAQYRDRYGAKLNDDGTPNERPPAICPACRATLFLRGEASNAVAPNFAHHPGAGFCPIKSGGAHKYSVLPPTTYNSAIGDALRRSFFKNWKLHWLRFRDYVGFVSVADFIMIIKYMDAKRMWEYHSLREYEIPYVLLVLKDFKPVRKAAKKGDVSTAQQYWRHKWVRFWFDASITLFDDYWNLSANNRRPLLKALYTTSPTAKRPNPDDISDFEYVQIDLHFLTRPAPTSIDSKVAAKMKVAFPKDVI